MAIFLNELMNKRKNKMRISKKILFYFLLTITNALAFLFLGISFLSGYSYGGEGTIVYSEFQKGTRLSLYAFIVSLIFSLIASLLSFVFRKNLNYNRNSIMKIFTIEFLLFVLVFYISYIIVYIV